MLHKYSISVSFWNMVKITMKDCCGVSFILKTGSIFGKSKLWYSSKLRSMQTLFENVCAPKAEGKLLVTVTVLLGNESLTTALSFILKHISQLVDGFTCVFATVHLQMRQLEVAFVASWVGTHERTLLAAFWPHNGRSDARHPPYILRTHTYTHTKHFYFNSVLSVKIELSKALPGRQ